MHRPAVRAQIWHCTIEAAADRLARHTAEIGNRRRSLAFRHAILPLLTRGVGGTRGDGRGSRTMQFAQLRLVSSWPRRSRVATREARLRAANALRTIERRHFALGARRTIGHRGQTRAKAT